MRRWVLLLMLAAVPVRAADGPAVRAGDHPGFGRVVFELQPWMSVDTVVEDRRVLVVVKGATEMEAMPPPPRNVLKLRGDGNAATLVLAEGASVRRTRLGNRLVVDVLDPAAPSPATRDVRKPAPASPAQEVRKPTPPSPVQEDRTPGATAPVSAAPVLAAPVSAAPATMTPNGKTPEDRGAARLGEPSEHPPSALPPPGVAAAGPMGATAVPIPVQSADLPAPRAAEASPAPSPPSTTFVLPADTVVGAAAFRRGEWAVVVLDRRMADLAPLPGITVVLGPVTTVLQWPLPPDQGLVVSRAAAGWSVTTGSAAPGEPAAASMALLASGEAVRFPLPRPGRVVTILDPAAGGNLLVGTSLAGGPEAALGPGRLTPEYAILPTWLGVAIDPVADRVDLRATVSGYVLQGGTTMPKPLVVAQAGRRLDIPDEAAPALLNRLRAQLASAAGAAPRAYSGPRLAAAQAMVALGMGAEAQGVIQTLIADDPQAAADATLPALSAIAAVLAGRLDETSALDDPRLDDQPEMLLWRGLRDRRRGAATPAAAALPRWMALAQGYPDTLRRLVWPDIAEAAVEGGAKLPEGGATPYAEALLLERSGAADEAAAAWKAIADGADRRASVRATARLIDLRLAAGTITPAQAADLAERLVFAWRGDLREVALRLRAAELRAAAGGWRPALDYLRETEAAFPDQAAAIKPRKAAVFESMLAAEGRGLSPLDVVLLAADYADCVPDGAAGAALAGLLADKLMALDLPARAIPVLQGLIAGSSAGPARSEFGASLGRLLLEGGDAAGARAALDASAAAGLTPALIERRAILTARARAAGGDMAGAVADLEGIGSAAAHEARAAMLADAGDWRGSLKALNDLAEQQVPVSGPLPDAAQALVIRQASAAARIPDAAQLRALSQQIPRMTPPRSDVLQVLTGSPITSISELPRAAKELKVARSISQQF